MPEPVWAGSIMQTGSVAKKPGLTKKMLCADRHRIGSYKRSLHLSANQTAALCSSFESSFDCKQSSWRDLLAQWDEL